MHGANFGRVRVLKFCSDSDLQNGRLTRNLAEADLRFSASITTGKRPTSLSHRSFTLKPACPPWATSSVFKKVSGLRNRAILFLSSPLSCRIHVSCLFRQAHAPTSF